MNAKLKEILKYVITMVCVFVLASSTLLIMTEVKKANGWNKTNVDAMTDDESKFVTLSYYYVVSSMPKDLATVNNELNKLLKRKLNCEVRLKPIIESEYDATLSLMINSADEFDICFTSNWILDYYENAKLGAFVDLTNVLEKYAPTIAATVPQKLKNAASVNGKLYGTVNTQVIPRTPGLTFNAEWYDKFMQANPSYKFDSLESLEEYFKFCILNKADQTNMCEGFYPEGLLVYWGFDDIGGVSSPGVVRVTDEECKVINQFESQEFKDMISLARNYYSKGYMGDISKALVQAKELVYLASTWKPGGSEEESLARGATLINVPIGESYCYNSWLLNSLNAISVTSKNPIRALKLLELLYSDKEVFNLLTYGKENVHYTKTGYNTIKSIADSGYNVSNAWEFGNQFNAYLLDGQAEDTWEKTKALNETAKDSVLVGFQFDPSPVSVEILNCNSVYDEFISTFIYGAYLEKTDAKYAEFIEKMNAAGAQRIIEEKQKQINEWLGKTA